MDNFFQYIRERYNIQTCSLLKQYSRKVEKLAKTIERSKYLQTCRQLRIIPTHVSDRTHNINSLFSTKEAIAETEKIKNNLHIKLLSIEIKETHRNVALLKNNFKIAEREIKNTLTEKEFAKFKTEQWKKFYNIRNKIKNTHHSKITRLKQENFKKYNLVFNEDWFLNYTNVDFDFEVKWILSLGPKFAIPVNNKNFSPIPLIADIEQWVQNIKEEADKEGARSNVANRIANYKRNFRNTEKEKFILGIYEEAKKFVKQHENKIIITTADKGNKTVVLYKNEYKEKMLKLLGDRKTYKITKDDPTEKLRKTNNNIITELFKQNHITRREKADMIMHSAASPELYGLPKIHKAELPLRPISASTKVPCYKLAKHIGKVLKHLISPIYNIKNSQELKNKLNDISLDDDDILVSFDVVSLFTNIPIHLAISNILNKWEKITEITDIPKKQFLKILQFCLKDNNYFKFDGKHYFQLYGMPMGNPLSPTIADIVLDALLDDVIKELNSKDIKIKFISKYVDDLFAIIKKPDEAQILKTLNAYHNKLQFTIEKENNDKIAYLDMMIIKRSGKIITNWFIKPTSSGRIINYNSTQPTQMKINTATNLIIKAFKLSDGIYQEDNITRLRHILMENNYPIGIINNLINKTLKNHKKETTPKNNNEENIFFSVPFIPNLTEINTLKSTLTEEKIKIAYKSNKTLRDIFTYNKTKTEKLKTDNVVYEIKCQGNVNESCEKIYIGTTKRMLGTRINEHKLDIEKRRTSTALSQHAKELNHLINFDDVKILNREKKENKRFTIESLRIQQRINKTMNTKEDKDNIKLQYSVAISN